MTVKAKLIEKLKSLSLKKEELKTLLGSMGFGRRSGKGSHERWIKRGLPPIVIATHDKEVKPYQLKQVLKVLKIGGLI